MKTHCNLLRRLAWTTALAAGIPALFAKDPAWYVRQSTWHETMLASVQALHQAHLERGFPDHESEIVRGGEPARFISVDVSGASRMHLFVTGDPDKVWGVANWAEARLVDKQGRTHSLTSGQPGLPGRAELNWKALKGRHAININLHSGLYEPLRIGGRQFDRGIHVQADSELMVVLDGQYERFEAWIGIDDWSQGRGNVRFSVLGPRAAALKELWDLLARDFPEGTPRREMRWEQQDRIWQPGWPLADWPALANRYAQAAACVPPLARQTRQALTKSNLDGLQAVRTARRFYLQARTLDDARRRLRQFNYTALRLAIQDLIDTFKERYPRGIDYLRRLSDLHAQAIAVLDRIEVHPDALVNYQQASRVLAELENLRQQALLANPLLDFDRLLVIKRKPMGDPRRSQWDERGLGEYLGLPRQSSWGHGTMQGVDRWENEIAVLSPVRPDGQLHRLYKPDRTVLVADVDLHWNADKMLFSMPDDSNNWQVCELQLEGPPAPPGGTGAGPQPIVPAIKQVRQLTPGLHREIHNYDAIYLPNDEILFDSTAPLQGVPCNASVIVGMMYKMGPNGEHIRQVAFEQDHDYTPSVMEDGRVLYLRWDYTDTPHVWNRLLMTMNPDGTEQRRFYGGNSYWPNGIFYARAVPGHPTKVIGIVTGHHEGRVGELILFDAAKGQQEADGVVQRIPGRGQRVEPLIEDKLTEHSWPKFLHPWPLSDKYFLVACKPEQDSLWGIYLVDVFDNMLLLREEEHYALLEPVPFRPQPRPPVIQDRIQQDREDGLVYMEDVYAGPGLEGVPRGAVKKLRVFTYHFGFQHMAGIDHRVGADGPWEVKRVLGTVPVEPDGSAMFRIPAKTPISVQPLDENGAALALMRSWMTAMPGETLSCVGCHEDINSAGLNKGGIAAKKMPRPIEPWHGPARGFSFAREVQPVLDRYCVGCHNGQPREDGRQIPDLRGDQDAWVVYRHGNPELQVIRGRPREELLRKYAGVFQPSYIALRALVRVGGLESDLHVLPPMEFHANTSELIQMLRKGHHGVQLDAEAWDRLYTWIDLNAPCHGTWSEVHKIPIPDQPERRCELRKRFGGVARNDEEIPPLPRSKVEPIIPKTEPRPPKQKLACEGWPFDAREARLRQRAAGRVTRTLDLGGGVKIEFVRIPAGRFIMGDPHGAPDEWPLSVVEIKRPFWMSRCEISNEQYARFDPSHDSRFEHRSSWIFSEAYLGWPLNSPHQPVVRVSWNQAMAFCQWLSAQTGLRITLPTEAQWEYACRAGSDTAFWYGDGDTDFSRFANLADQNIRRLAYDGWRPRPPDIVPRDDRFDDGALVTAEVGRYQPNPWGLYDMHGNAAEWTRSTYRPYPYQDVEDDGQAPSTELKVVRGGSWRDRPKRARSGFRLSYPAYQRIYNVGFRIIIEEAPNTLTASNH